MGPEPAVEILYTQNKEYFWLWEEKNNPKPFDSDVIK